MLFRSSLAELCGNRRLHGLIMSFWDQSHRVRMFTLRLRPRPDESTREHRQVTEAILAGDVERAQRLYRLHRERAQEALLQIIEDYGLKRL